MTEYNKVVYDGQTLIDLTQDDVTASDVRNGVYFHNSAGVRGQGTLTSTSIPTASTIAEFDSDAHMNSDDMTSQEVDDFVDGLNVSGGGGWVYVPLTSSNPSMYINPAGGYYKLGRLVVVQCRFYVTGTFPSSDYNTVTGGLPVPSEIQVSLGVTWNYADSATHASAVVSSTGSLVVQSGSKALTASTLFITGAYIAE